jgi:hypothetical protein
LNPLHTCKKKRRKGEKSRYTKIKAHGAYKPNSMLNNRYNDSHPPHNPLPITQNIPPMDAEKTLSTHQKYDKVPDIQDDVISPPSPNK